MVVVSLLQGWYCLLRCKNVGIYYAARTVVLRGAGQLRLWFTLAWALDQYQPHGSVPGTKPTLWLLFTCLTSAKGNNTIQ